MAGPETSLGDHPGTLARWLVATQRAGQQPGTEPLHGFLDNAFAPRRSRAWTGPTAMSCSHGSSLLLRALFLCRRRPFLFVCTEALVAVAGRDLTIRSADSTSADAFRGISRASSIPPPIPPPSLISTAGKLGFARELVIRVVILKARGWVFDIRGGLGAASLLKVHRECGSPVSRGTLPMTVRSHSFFVRFRRSWEFRILMSSTSATQRISTPSCPDLPSGTRSP